MSGLIPQRFIEDLLSRVDIVDVVATRIPSLKRAGKNHTACCPFHQDKTPSFSVQHAKQFYYCFGCGASGNALQFICAFDHLDFPAAVELLAREQGLEVPREGSKAPVVTAANREHSTALLQAVGDAAEYFRDELRSHTLRDRAVSYLKLRGVSGEIAKSYGLGYAPAGRDNLVRALGRERAAMLVEAGLLGEGENANQPQFYDRFRDRIMFPIRDQKGRIVGFGGRVISDEIPKYLNSPETPLFRKAELLYGLFEARSRVRDLQKIIVVEGYMDVIALAQHGIQNSVAALGTATSSQHVQQLFKCVQEVVFCFDGDKAGQAAAWRALQQALPLMEDGRSVRFAFLPEGQDPDDYVRTHCAVEFEVLLSQALPLSEYFYQRLRAQAKADASLDSHARLCALALPYLRLLPDNIFRRLMVGRLAELTQLDLLSIERQLSGATARVLPFVAGAKLGSSDTAGGEIPSAYAWLQPTTSARLVALLLHKPALAIDVALDDLPAAAVGGVEALLRQVVNLTRLHPDGDSVELRSRLMATASAGLTEAVLALPGVLLAEPSSHLVAALLEQLQGERSELARVQVDLLEMRDKLRQQHLARQDGVGAALRPS